MELMGFLFLGFDSPSPDIMLQPPIMKADSIITNRMKYHIIGQTIYMVIVLLIVLFGAEYIIPEDCVAEKENYCRMGTTYMRTGRRFDYAGNEAEGLFSEKLRMAR